jgi:hypothetical protein
MLSFMGKKAKRKSADEFQVGDRALLHYGTHDFIAEIIEDRGHIGMGGRRLVRIRMTLEPEVEPFEFEVPAEDLRPVPAR